MSLIQIPGVTLSAGPFSPPAAGHKNLFSLLFGLFSSLLFPRSYFIFKVIFTFIFAGLGLGLKKKSELNHYFKCFTFIQVFNRTKFFSF